jgi:cytochrome c-type biogenesis protein CcmH/NrfG
MTVDELESLAKRLREVDRTLDNLRVEVAEMRGQLNIHLHNHPNGSRKWLMLGLGIAAGLTGGSGIFTLLGG